MKHETNGIRKEIDKVLEGNGWISSIDLAEKIHQPIIKTQNILEEMEKEGIIDGRPAK